ncbi:MAG TPA: response regulator transcription factor [Acidimicrobiales bacterium]|nr:response regulator transcription factor [Acidimicrobiales bacterium]
MVNVSRILIVDDDPGMRELLRTALTRDGFAVEEAADAAGGERAVEAVHPDLAILDIRLGAGPDGLTLARRLRARSDLPIVFLTDANEVEDRLAGFETGADDYIPKPFVVAELLARVRALLRRSGALSGGTLEAGPLRIDENGRRVFLRDDQVDLTRIEFELLAVLAKQTGRVVSKSELLSRVWGFDGYDQNLVEVHVSSLRRKLGTGASLIETVRGVGYVLRV